MTDKNYMKRRFKCRCYQKDNTVKIYDGSEILFDVSYRDFDDAFYLGRKLQSVIMELNELHEEKKELHVQCNLLREQANEFHRGARENANGVGQLEKENKELQERNNRQAKQLGNIYHLIEKQDWKTLKGIIEEFKECEEQLQKEWSTYGDV